MVFLIIDLFLVLRTPELNLNNMLNFVTMYANIKQFINPQCFIIYVGLKCIGVESYA